MTSIIRAYVLFYFRFGSAFYFDFSEQLLSDVYFIYWWIL